MPQDLVDVKVPRPNICRERVINKTVQPDSVECALASGRSIRVSTFLSSYIQRGDEVEFNLPVDNSQAGTELHIIKSEPTAGFRHLYQAQIGYVTQPKTDKHQHPYVFVALDRSHLGLSGIHLTCAALRDYFYSSNRTICWSPNKNFYEILKVKPTSSLGDLRLAFRLRRLELQAAQAPKSTQKILVRAFNILAIPELRACYDGLLTSPGSPVLFPFGGFGSLLVAGTPYHEQFFASRIIAFLPRFKRRHLKVALRKLLFYNDRAVYRDSRSKVEITLDPVVLPLSWDANWNQWKHLLGATVDIRGDFVKTGKYFYRSNQWQLITWETALPSRIELSLPEDIVDSVNTARLTHHRFGQYSSVLESIRQEIQLTPLEKTELARLCTDHGIPSDFDVAQITWRPDYAPYYYDQLLQRARRLYLFRDQYIFLLDSAVVIETPQCGHATYVFSRPENIDLFLRCYVKTTKEAIRKNQENVAEQLGFQGRIVHGTNRKQWLFELCCRIGH